MDCVIRVIEGPDKGAEAALPPGTALVGRSPRATLRLTAPDVSHEHLLITRSGDEYFAENLSARGTFIDGRKITGQVRLRPRQQIRLSEQTVLRLEQPGGSPWQRWRIAILAAAVVLVAAIVFALTRAPSPRKTENDWQGAWIVLHDWLRRQTAARRLPADAPALFAEAWRLEQAAVYDSSQKLWLKLQLMIDTAEDRLHMKALSAEHPLALQRLLTPAPEDPQPTDAELAAAVVQFVNRRLAWAARHAAQPSSGWFR